MSSAPAGRVSQANRVRKRAPNAHVPIATFVDDRKLDVLALSHAATATEEAYNARFQINNKTCWCLRSVYCVAVYTDTSKLTVISRTLALLQQDASRATRSETEPPQEHRPLLTDGNSWPSISNSEVAPRLGIEEPVGDADHSSSTSTSHIGIDQPGSPSSHNVGRRDTEPNFINPLVFGRSAYAAVPTGQTLLLGSSSNWSFGRRALALVHKKVSASPIPDANLHFDGSTYELGWDGRRTTASVIHPALPTVDHALFLINTVKFHCGQLFHVFDNDVFMHHFGVFHERTDGQSRCPELWYIHYLIVLAMGKSLVGRTRNVRKPSGADLFVHAMQLLPDQTFLWTDPFQSTEILCCAALYMQCLDMRIVAYNIIGQAMRTAIAFGFHTDMPSDQHSPDVIERCRKIWWTIYILDSHMSALMGAPRTIGERDISAQLPNYSGSTHRSRALHVHIKLANIEGLIQQTVYSKEGRTGENFLSSIKTALRALADINDERTSNFPLILEGPDSGISRLSAHLHLFHHQCIILNTKPLLFSYLQKRVDTAKPVRIPSSGGIRSLLRVCVGSAHQTTKILAALQTQTLLDVFIPFDLESTWSAALVLLIIPVVDPSLAKDTEASLKVAYDVFSEMAAVGNSVAACRQEELEQLEKTLRALEAMRPTDPVNGTSSDGGEAYGARNMDTGQSNIAQSDVEHMSAYSFDVEEVLTAQQLEAVADSMNINGLDWSWVSSCLEQLDPSLL